MVAKIIQKEENLGLITKKKSNNRAFAMRAKKMGLLTLC